MITAIIVGAGHRAMIYAEYAKIAPDKFKIVGVADPIELRRKLVAEEYGLKAEQCYRSAQELTSKGKIADAIINGTMDSDHVSTTVPLLELGYDVLLEKPFAVSEQEIDILENAVKRTKRKVMICHVLRYAPFYSELKKRVLNEEIGKIINIQTVEHVSYHHFASCFVRGKWRSKDQCGSSVLMAKCCHDLDLLTWFNSGSAPTRVASFGGQHFFNIHNAPEKSGNYCLLDCPIEKECLYSVRKLHLENPERWFPYVWSELEHIDKPTAEDYESFLKQKDNPYSRCVWKMDNNVVDRQSVMIEFSNGSTATHNLVGGTSRPMRNIHIIGSHGELQGIMDDNRYVMRQIDSRAGHEYIEKEYRLSDEGDTTGAFGGHGGGDLRLVEDFTSVLEGDVPSISCTELADSIYGHRIGFAADLAMASNRVIRL